MKKKILVPVACLFLFVSSFVVTNAVNANAVFDNAGCGTAEADACRLLGCAGCASPGSGGQSTCIGCKGGGGGSEPELPAN